MTQDKTAIQSLEDLDKKMLEQKQRLEVKEESQIPLPPMESLPFTEKMAEAFKENIIKSTKCLACGWQNFGQILMLMNTMNVMQESLPLPTMICGQCGTLFVPKWARKIARQAIEQENKIVKQTGGARDETGG